MIKLASGILSRVWQHLNTPLILLLVSQKNGHSKQSPKESRDQCSPATLLWLLLLIMHKFLELSRVYGYLDVLVSFRWHLLNFQRTRLPGVVFSSDLDLRHYYYNTATNREPQGRQSSSSHRAQSIIHDVYLFNTHNILCDQRAGAGSLASSTTQCDYKYEP